MEAARQGHVEVIMIVGVYERLLCRSERRRARQREELRRREKAVVDSDHDGNKSSRVEIQIGWALGS